MRGEQMSCAYCADATLGAVFYDQCCEGCVKRMSWPFPAPTGPVPWTAKQQRDYAAQQRQQTEEAPL